MDRLGDQPGHALADVAARQCQPARPPGELDSTAGTTGDNYTLTYDAAGNVIDDGQRYECEWDAFGRLKQVMKTSGSARVSEYWYNGLGQRIRWTYDTDTDDDVDGDDQMYHLVYDSPETWRVVATYRETDANPKEQFVPHEAGLDGMGGSLPLDMVILRDRDDTNGWTGAADGTLEERRYLLPSMRGDVAVIINHNGSSLIEQVRYSPYGVAYGIPAGDVNGDGTVSGTDNSVLLGLYSAYEARGDLDLDGDVDSADTAILLGNWGLTLGWNKLSLPAVGNRKGYAGYEHDGPLPELCHVRHRVLHTGLGRWLSRDAAGYTDGMNLYEYAGSNSMTRVDPMGLAFLPAGGGPGGDLTSGGVGPQPTPPPFTNLPPGYEYELCADEATCGKGSPVGSRGGWMPLPVDDFGCRTAVCEFDSDCCRHWGLDCQGAYDECVRRNAPWRNPLWPANDQEWYDSCSRSADCLNCCITGAIRKGERCTSDFEHRVGKCSDRKTAPEVIRCLAEASSNQIVCERGVRTELAFCAANCKHKNPAD